MEDAKVSSEDRIAGLSILVVSYHFYPSSAVGAKRPSELVRFLKGKGAEVTVLRSYEPQTELGSGLQEIQGLKYIRVPVSKKFWSNVWVWLKRIRICRQHELESSREIEAKPTESNLLRKLFEVVREYSRSFESILGAQKRWLVRAIMMSGSIKTSKFDLVFVSGPVSCAYILGYVLARRHSARLILDMRDPWHVQGDPDTFPGRMNYSFAKIEAGLRRRVLQQSDLITVASFGIKEHLLELRCKQLPRIEVIFNGYDPDMKMEVAPPCGMLRMLFAGTLYLNRNPFPMFEAIRNLIREKRVDRARLAVTLVGDCCKWQGRSTIKWICENGLNDVISVLAPVSASRIREMIKKSNVLINFAQGQPRQIPAKSFEYLASGRDILLFAEEGSDSAILFSQTGGGEIVHGDDQDMIQEAIVKLVERHSKESGKSDSFHCRNIEDYSREVMNKKFEGAICSIFSAA